MPLVVPSLSKWWEDNIDAKCYDAPTANDVLTALRSENVELKTTRQRAPTGAAPPTATASMRTFEKLFDFKGRRIRKAQMAHGRKAPAKSMGPQFTFFPSMKIGASNSTATMVCRIKETPRKAKPANIPSQAPVEIPPITPSIKATANTGPMKINTRWSQLSFFIKIRSYSFICTTYIGRFLENTSGGVPHSIKGDINGKNNRLIYSISFHAIFTFQNALRPFFTPAG